MGEKNLDDKNENPDVGLSVKDLITIGDFIEKLKNIISDPDCSLIIAQLILNKLQTFEDFKKNIKSMDVYQLTSVLKKLSDYDLVIKKDDKYCLSIYNLQQIFDTANKYDRKNNLIRESTIGSLFLFKALLDHEITMLLNENSQDFEEKYVNGKIHEYFRFITAQMINKEIFIKYQRILTPIYSDFLKEVREYDENSKYEALNPYIMYFGYFYYPNLDKE